MGISPNIKNRGSSFTMTLKLDPGTSPAPPPKTTAVSSVKIGDITGTQLSHVDGTTVRARFTIPAAAVVGPHDVTVSFPPDIIYTLADGFIVNPFTVISGSYRGLALNTVTSTHETDGHIKVDLTTSGSYSGTLIIGGVSYGFKGKFNTEGASTSLTIKRKAPLSPLTLSMSTDVESTNGSVTGTVTDGIFSSAFTAARGVFKSTNPLPPGIAGRYTAIFDAGPITSGTPPNAPGYGTLTVGTYGAISFSGVLGDGNKFSQSSQLSPTLDWPFYTALYSTKGSAFGNIAFSSATNSDFSGAMKWFKPATTSKVHPGPYASDLGVTGSRFVTPAKGFRVLNFPNTTNNATATLFGGNLDEFMKGLTLNTTNKFIVVSPSTDKLSLGVSTTDGKLSGSFIHPGTKKSVKVGGVVFQKSTNAVGQFPGTNSIGTVTIEPSSAD